MLSEGKVGEKNAYRKGEEERYVKIGRGTAESVFAHQVGEVALAGGGFCEVVKFNLVSFQEDTRDGNDDYQHAKYPVVGVGVCSGPVGGVVHRQLVAGKQALPWCCRGIHIGLQYRVERECARGGVHGVVL